MAVSDFSSQNERHNFRIGSGWHFVPNDFECFVDKLWPTFKDFSHHTPDVFCGYRTQARIAERKAEAVAAIGLTSRREILQEILVVKAT